MKVFERMIRLRERTGKPRENGLTMVIDKGLGMREAQDLVEVAGDYIDLVKIGFGTARLYERDILRSKINIYRQNRIEVMCGGTLLEIIILQNKIDEYLKDIEGLRITVVELSDGTIDMEEETRSKLIRKIKDHEFKVVSEVGKKDPKKELSTEEMIRKINLDIENGVFKVLVEGGESGAEVGLYDEGGGIKEDRLNQIVAGVKDINKIMFETSRKSQQVYMIKRFGPEVNLGNILPAEVLSLESLRLGLCSDTLLDSLGTPKERNIVAPDGAPI